MPDPPTISKLPPNSTLKFVEVSSPIVIELNAKADAGIFVIVLFEPSIVLFVIVCD